MDLTTGTSFSTLQSVKERMKEKIGGTLKAMKLQSSLAAKIKAKNFNNSSVLKVSLKHNNRTLACALTAEKEKARRLENDKMFLQKEVKMLHFQNALLRQNLSILNKMLKDIDLFMNVNLPAAIEISSINESVDLSVTEEEGKRISCQSRRSLDEHQEFRLTGMPLRVPSRPSEQQKFSSGPAGVLNEEKYPIDSFSLNNPVTAESPDVQHEVLEPSDLAPNDCTSAFSRTIKRDSLLNVEVDAFVLPPGEDLTASSRFVTKRRRRSTISRSSTQSVNSDINQSKISLGSCRGSSQSTQFDIGKDNSNGACDEVVYNFVKNSKCNGIKENLCSSDKENVLETDRPNLVHSVESEQSPVDCRVEQEQTVYEADMEMTSSDSAAIVAVLPKNKTKTSKSGIPRKQDGASLRKVKITAREKTKKMSSCTTKESGEKNDDCKENVDSSLNVNVNIIPQFIPSKDFKSALAERYDSRRTYVLTKPVNQDKMEGFESADKSDSQKEMETSFISGIAEGLYTNVNNVFNRTDEISFSADDMLSLEVNHHTNDAAPKKRKSNVRKRCSKDTNTSRKKKRKISTSRNQEQTVDVTHTVTNVETLFQMDSRETHSTERPSIKNLEPQIRRETYVIGSTKPNSELCEFVPQNNSVNYRRETFVIPNPNPATLVAFASEEQTGTAGHYSHLSRTNVSIASQPEIENALHIEKAGLVSHDFDTDHSTFHDYKEKRLVNCLERSNNCGSSSLFYKDGPKTCVLPAKRRDFRTDKDTLVRESFMNVTQCHSVKATKVLNAVTTNQQDSFMLDMVSESILDETLDCPSFTAFPTTTNPDSTYMVNITVNNPSLPPDPVSDSCSTLESEHPNTPKSAGNLDENDNNHTQEMFTDDGNPQCKVEDCSIEIHDAGVKPFQDLTNKTLSLIKQSPKSSLEEEEDVRGHFRRRRNAVNYKEPSLGAKLRRGETDGFINSKEKGKKGRKKK